MTLIKQWKFCTTHEEQRGDSILLDRRVQTQRWSPWNVVCRGSVEEWLPDGTAWRILGTHTDVADILLKDALVARERFVSRMSHEIRSPLCAVLNECDLYGGPV